MKKQIKNIAKSIANLWCGNDPAYCPCNGFHTREELKDILIPFFEKMDKMEKALRKISEAYDMGTHDCQDEAFKALGGVKKY